MKELEVLNADKVAIVGQRAHEKKLQFIGRLKPQKGQSVWQLNLKTREVKLADFDDVALDLHGNVKKKIIIKPLSMYCVAINVKNAQRKFIKMVRNL